MENLELFDFENDFLSVDGKANIVSSQIKWANTHRKTEYLGQVFKLQKHKSVAVRRNAVKAIFNLGRRDDVFKIEEWQKNEVDRETWLLLESLKVNLALKNEGVSADKSVLTVSEALFLIRQNVGAGKYTIEGEIDEVNIYTQKFPAIYYLVLKDEEGQTLKCQCLEFVANSAGFALNVGLSVRFTGVFKISKNGVLFLDIEKIELTGDGALAKNLKDLQEKLESEGLMDEGRKRVIPKLPEHVLLLASPNSAAVTDYMKVLNNRIGGVKIYLLPIKTQGIGAERIMLDAIEKASEYQQKIGFDVCVITRGGGAKDDLSLFNSEKVVRAIYGLPVPTIVAIGHERDTTLSELVADRRASTPSQAAEFSSVSRAEVKHIVNQSIKGVTTIIRYKVRAYETVCKSLLQNIFKIIRFKLEKIKSVFQKKLWEIRNFITILKFSIEKQQRVIVKIVRDRKILYEIKNLPILEVKKIFDQQKSLVKVIYSTILGSVFFKLERQKSFTLQTYSHIENINPKKIMTLGYAKILSNELDPGFKIGQKLKIETLKYRIQVEVLSLESE